MHNQEVEWTAARGNSTLRNNQTVMHNKVITTNVFGPIDVGTNQNLRQFFVGQEKVYEMQRKEGGVLPQHMTK